MNKLTASISRSKNIFTAAALSAEFAKWQGFFNFAFPQSIATENSNLDEKNFELIETSNWDVLDWIEPMTEAGFLAAAGIDLGAGIGTYRIGKFAYTKLLSKRSPTEKQQLLLPPSKQENESSKNSRTQKIRRLALLLSFFAYYSYSRQKFKSSIKFEPIPDEQVLEKTIDFFKREASLKNSQEFLNTVLVHFGPNPNKDSYKFAEVRLYPEKNKTPNLLREITNLSKRDYSHPHLTWLYSRFKGAGQPNTSECLEIFGLYTQMGSRSLFPWKRVPDNNIFARFEAWSIQSINKHKTTTPTEEQPHTTEDISLPITDKHIPFWLGPKFEQFNPRQAFDVSTAKYGVYQCSYKLNAEKGNISCIPKDYWISEAKKVTDPKIRDYLTSREPIKA